MVMVLLFPSCLRSDPSVPILLVGPSHALWQVGKYEGNRGNVRTCY